MIPWQYTLYIITVFISVAILGALIIYAWRHRATRGATAFAGLLFSVVLWSLFVLMEMLSATPERALLWGKCSYFGVVGMAPTWLAFALQYTGREKWLAPRYLLLLVVEPLLTLTLIWTNETHGIFWRSIVYVQDGALFFPEVVYGLGFWLHLVYLYALMFVGTLLVVRMGITASYLYRGQAIALVFGAMAPWTVNVLYIFGFTPTHLNLVPFGFTLAGISFAWALFRYRLFDLTPVARDALIDRMSDGMLVLDRQERIVDLNPAMQKIVGVSETGAIGRPIAEILDYCRELAVCFEDETLTSTELALAREGEIYYYSTQIAALTDRRGAITGKLVVLRDITARKRAEQAEQAALQREMNLARDIQASLLPQEAPHISGIDAIGQCTPAREVGGDWYNYYELPRSKWNPRGGYALAVGDVSGKGVPAALYMAVSTTLLTAKAPFVMDVPQLLTELNGALYPYMSHNRMNTALCYVRLEPHEHNGYTAHIANAGLVAPILRRGRQCEYLDVGGVPLGMMLNNLSYDALELSLQEGDILVLSSDGVVEAMDAAGEMYGFDRLQARVAEAPATSALEIQAWILAGVRAFVGDAEPHDDMTMVVIVVKN